MTGHELSKEKARVSVLGGGAWDTALAMHCARKGHDVLIWAREPEVVESVNNEHENTMFFKVRRSCCRRLCRILFVVTLTGSDSAAPQGFKLPENVKASPDLVEVAKYGELILVVIPTPFVDRVMGPLADIIKDDQASS